MADEALVAAVAAGVGGAFSSVVLHPLDAIKTKMQSASKKSGDATTLSTAREMVDEGGVGSLYVGVWIKAVESALTKAIYYYIYAGIGGGTFSSVYAELFAGYIAEMGNKPITHPMEMVAYRMICSKRNMGPVEALREVVAEKGVLGLYSGIAAVFLSSIKPAIHFGIFEEMKKRVLAGGQTHLTFAQSFIFGAAARALSTTATYPFIRAKVLAMTQDSAGGLFAIILDQLQQGGVSGLFRGAGPEISRGVLSTALMLSVKEQITGGIRRYLPVLLSIFFFRSVSNSSRKAALK